MHKISVTSAQKPAPGKSITKKPRLSNAVCTSETPTIPRATLRIVPDARFANSGPRFPASRTASDSSSLCRPLSAVARNTPAMMNEMTNCRMVKTGAGHGIQQPRTEPL